MSAALDLALAVSWRSIHGPRASVRLSEFGHRSRSAARRLGMEIVQGVAYITARTPDLAERMLVESEQVPWKGSPHPARKAMERALVEWNAQKHHDNVALCIKVVADSITGPPPVPPPRGLRRNSNGTFLHDRKEFR